MAQLHVTRVKREFREIVTSDEVTCEGERGLGGLLGVCKTLLGCGFRNSLRVKWRWAVRCEVVSSVGVSMPSLYLHQKYGRRGAKSGWYAIHGIHTNNMYMYRYR